MAKISLNNMQFHAYHGCLDHEKNLGNTFVVSVSFEINSNQAENSDNLEHTLNYQKVYDIVKEQMEIRSNLIEHVTQRIINSLFERFIEIKTIDILLEKLNPPLGGKVESVSIEISKSRIETI